MKKKISILGSTGSIGTSTLSLVQDYPEHFEVVGLSAGKNMDVLFEQIQIFKPNLVSVLDEESRKILIEKGVRTEILIGEEGACQVAKMSESQMVVSAIVGASGLQPTFAAIEVGKEVLLANKESMVVSGAWMSKKVKEFNAKLRPIDSEHSAIFQSIQGTKHQDIKKIILTASGGPFFLKPEIHFDDVTLEQALAHPNWNMGAKITIDSATMMNKGLEVIEAKWLFDLNIDQIEVVVHPQSIIHSIVELVDGSSLCQMGIPHMRGPIAYALSYPDRLPNVIDPVDFQSLTKFDFFPPDAQRFPTIAMAYQALKAGPTYPAVLNGANEVAVEAFLDKTIRFSDIFELLTKSLDSYQEKATDSLQDYINADAWGRKFVKETIEKRFK